MTPSLRSVHAHSDVLDPEISPEEAQALTRAECRRRLDAFISALDMRGAVSPDKAAALVKHIVKDGMAGDSRLIAGQMRIDHWERELSNGDNPDVLAERIRAFLDTQEGADFHHFFAGLFAAARPSS